MSEIPQSDGAQEFIQIPRPENKSLIQKGGNWVRNVMRPRRLSSHEGITPTLQEAEVSETRRLLMDKFQHNLQVLCPAMQENRQNEKDASYRPLITVVVAIREENETMITSKMFRESLGNLTKQASSSNIDLDVVIVANNGGGTTEQLGEAMISAIRTPLQEQFGEAAVHMLTTSEPDAGENPSVPWNLSIPLTDDRVIGQNRCFVVKQPFDDRNAGKVRAIRDVSHALSTEIRSGYAPDAVFQMDAETILEYKTLSQKYEKEPFRVIYDALKDATGTVAVGTKDRFEPIDPETGKPLGVLRPIIQETHMHVNNDNFITLPGGSLLAEPDYYVAGMNAITEVTVGDVAEDYLFTQMVRAHAKSQQTDEVIKIDSLNIISHLNRCPQGKNAVRQMLRWKRQGAAVNQLFPDEQTYNDRLSRYTLLAIKSRLKEALGHHEGYWKQVVMDIKSIPGIIDFMKDKEVADMINGNPTWKHAE